MKTEEQDKVILAKYLLTTRLQESNSNLSPLARGSDKRGRATVVD